MNAELKPGFVSLCLFVCLWSIDDVDAEPCGWVVARNPNNNYWLLVFSML